MSKLTVAPFAFLIAFLTSSFTFVSAVAEEQKAVPATTSIKSTQPAPKAKMMRPTDRLGATIPYSFFL